jgi:photosystem II stability/assembly factor-like uncharacterized protein
MGAFRDLRVLHFGILFFCACRNLALLAPTPNGVTAAQPRAEKESPKESGNARETDPALAPSGTTGATSLAGDTGETMYEGPAPEPATPRTNVPPCNGTPVWTDVTSAQIAALGGASAQSYPGGASGVAASRLNGDITVFLVGQGLWRSTDKGTSWSRIDQGTVGTGRCETGWCLQIDQDDPSRMAVFTLDGDAAFTPNGTTWKRFTHAPWYRNFDHGSVDWSDPEAKTVFGIQHETSPVDQFTLSTDGGESWSAQDAGRAARMIGVIDSRTLVIARGNGIERSTNGGMSWSLVSSLEPASRIPVRFKNEFYLLTKDGLIVSSDQGASWQRQGAGVANETMILGPYFGADAQTMVIGTQRDGDYNAFSNASTIYKTTDGGETWKKIADVPAQTGGFPFSFSWFGQLAWDPIGDIYYVSAMSNPGYRLDCTP